jgi:hypothetical protein
MKKVNRKNKKGSNYVTRYTKLSSRPLYYKVKNKDLDTFPEDIRINLGYQKTQPEITIKDRKVVWRCKGRPTVTIDFETETIYSNEMKDSTQRIKSNNQASHIVCASKKIGRVNSHYGKRRKRR